MLREYVMYAFYVSMCVLYVCTVCMYDISVCCVCVDATDVGTWCMYVAYVLCVRMRVM